MTNERDPRTLSELQREHSKVSTIIDQRQGLLSRISREFRSFRTKKEEFNKRGELMSIEDEIRLGKLEIVRPKVDVSIDRLGSRLDQIKKELESLQDETLVANAEEYLQQITQTSINLDRLERLARRGAQTSPQTLGQYRTQFLSLVEKPTTDESLKRGLELLKRRQKREPGEKVKDQSQVTAVEQKEQVTAGEPQREEEPGISFNQETREIKVGNHTLKIPGRVRFAVLAHLAQNFKAPIRTEELDKVARSIGAKGKRPINTAIGDLIKIFTENPHINLQIISRGRGRNTRHSLASRTAETKMVAEARPEQELPTMVVDEKTRKVTIDGRLIKFYIGGTKRTCGLFLYCANHPNQDIPYNTIEEIARSLSSTRNYSAGSLIYQLMLRLELDTKDPKLLTQNGHRRKSSFRLNANVEFIGRPLEITEQDLPKISINLKNREVKINGRQARFIRFRGKQYWQVFSGYIALHPNEDIPSTALAQFARGAGSQNKYPAGNAVDAIRHLIEENPFAPKLLVTLRGQGRNNSIYRLNAQVEFVEQVIAVSPQESKAKSTIAKEKPRKVYLADGQIVETAGMRAKALERLLQTSREHGVSIGELAIILSGVNNYKNRQNATAQVSNIRNLVRPLGFDVFQLTPKEERTKRFHEGRYWLGQVGQRSQVETSTGKTALAPETNAEPVVEEPKIRPFEIEFGGKRIKIEGTKKQEEIMRSFLSNPMKLATIFSGLAEGKSLSEMIHELGLSESVGREKEIKLKPKEESRLTSEIIDVPYVPTEEEELSEEEAKILDIVSTSLRSGSRLYLEDLQRQLKSEIENRSRILGGKTQWRIYGARELYDKYLSAFRKMREDSEIPSLREKWQDSQNSLWEKVVSLRQRLSPTGNNEEFLKRVKTELEKAEKDFFRNYGGKIEGGWISL